MYLVYDVGGTFIKYALMEGSGEIVKKDKLPTPVKQGQGLEDFVRTIGDIYDACCIEYDIEGIAMDLPGQIDVERGIVYGGGGLKYLDKVALGDIISKRCNGLHVALENDGKCAALAEVWKGNAADCQDAYVIVFGTGLGGGMIKDRKIHRGNRMIAGELSYFIGDMTREQAENIETSEQIEGIENTLEKLPFISSARLATAGMTLKVAKAKGLPMEEVNGVKIYQWAAEGDKAVQEMLEDWYFRIAQMCCSIYAIYDPDIILIGGGISAQPLFIEGIQRYVEKLRKISNIFKGMRVENCRFLNDSNLLGALFNYKQLYEEV